MALPWIIGSLVGAFFGRVWISIAATVFPGAQEALDIAGWVVFAGFVGWGVAVWLKQHRARQDEAQQDQAQQDRAQRDEARQDEIRQQQARQDQAQRVEQRRRDGRFFGTVVTIELALLFAGARILVGVLHHPEWVPTWTMLVVGAHFLPFARFFAGFRLLGAALTGIALVTAIAGAVTDSATAWYAIPGLGGAVSLWITAAVGLWIAGGRLGVGGEPRPAAPPDRADNRIE